MSYEWQRALQDLETFKTKVDEYKAAVRASVENEVYRAAGFTKIHTPDGDRWGITNAPPSGFQPLEGLSQTALDDIRKLIREELDDRVERAVEKALAQPPGRKLTRRVIKGSITRRGRHSWRLQIRRRPRSDDRQARHDLRHRPRHQEGGAGGAQPAVVRPGQRHARPSVASRPSPRS